MKGYTIIQDESNGWVFAKKATDGSLVPFLQGNKSIQVGNSEPKNLSKHVRPEISASDHFLISPPVFKAHTLGNRPILALLVSFSNQAPTYPVSHFQNILFGHSNSVKNYYQTASFNQFNFIQSSESYGTPNDGVIGWLNLGYNHPNTGSDTDTPNQQIVKDALIAANPYIDYASFDTNFDRYVSSNELQILVIVAGYERSTSIKSPSIWAHR